MWPWGHLAVGYVVYAVYTRYWHDRTPVGGPVVVLTVATQLPDLVDKPLAYTIGVLPGGRSLAHSLLIAGPVCMLALEFARRHDDWRAHAGIGFVIGYGTHLLGDSIHGLVGMEFADLTFLAWPVLVPPAYETTSFTGHIDQFVESGSKLGDGVLTPFLAEWVLFGVMVALWITHRAPPLPAGVAALRGALVD